MQRKYRHLFFDLDHTLWDFKLNSYYAAKAAIDELGIMNRIDCFDTFFQKYELINEALWDAYRMKKVTKQELTTRRFQEAFDAFELTDVPSGIEVNDRFLYHMPRQTQLIDGAVELLDRLANHYQIHIITNGFTQVQHQKIESSGLSKYVQRIFTSEEYQCPKPQRAIFEAALKSCNARKTESIMIGDSWESDIVGATSFGMDAIYFAPDKDQPFSKLDRTKKQGESFLVHALNDIPHILR